MAINLREFRTCLGQFATGVTVVSCRIEGAIHGATVNAFMAVSLEPPLIAVSLDRRSKVCTHLQDRPFTVTVLSNEAHDAALHFSGRPQPEVVVEWVDGTTAPALFGGIATFTCIPWATYEGGDHLLHLGEVQEIGQTYGDSPLLFYAGKFRDIGAHVAGSPWLVTLDSPESGVTWRTPRLRAPRRGATVPSTKEA